MEKMKRAFLLTTVTILVLVLSAFAKRCYDIWQQLSISQEEARESIFSNFQEGNLSFPYSTAIKGLASGQRGTVVRELGDQIRKYVNSPAFAEHYQEMRKSAQPAAPDDTEKKIRSRLAEIRHDIEENEKGLAQAKGDMRKLYEGTIQMLRTEEKALKDQKDPQHEMFVSNLSGSINNLTPEQYNAAMKEFEKQYPSNVKDLVRKRLQEFLDLTKDMDFNAKLVTVGRVKKFADPKLEAKDELWKRCFRSGEETITAARTYAAGWLKELK